MNHHDLPWDLVVIMSNADWSGMLLQKQRWAIMFAKSGIPVVYVNKTPQRTPSPSDLSRLSGLIRGQGIGSDHSSNSVPVPNGVEVVNLPLAPPVPGASLLNNVIVKRFAADLRKKASRILWVTYTPTPAMLELMRALKPATSAYVCVHNYPETPGINKSVVESEQKLAEEVDEVFCDSKLLHQLWSQRLARPVRRLMPACDPQAFRNAYRGDELKNRRVIGFFGGSFSELDLDIYQHAIDLGYNVQFVGPRDQDVMNRLNQRVDWQPPVAPKDLPGAIRSMDILLLAYRPSGRNDGVLPAKFFECLATGKPLLISPLLDMQDYADVVTTIDSPKALGECLANLQKTENSDKAEKRFKIAASSSWDRRFHDLVHDLKSLRSNPSCAE